MTLTEFLLARIAEDEAVVPRMHDWAHGNTDRGWYGKREPVGRREIVYGQTAARVLAECEAKRRIVEEYVDVLRWDTDEAGDHGIHGQRMGLEFAVKRLAAVYADHPDYRAEWKP